MERNPGAAMSAMTDRLEFAILQFRVQESTWRSLCEGDWTLHFAFGDFDDGGLEGAISAIATIERVMKDSLRETRLADTLRCIHYFVYQYCIQPNCPKSIFL